MTFDFDLFADEEVVLICDGNSTRIGNCECENGCEVGIDSVVDVVERSCGGGGSWSRLIGPE